MEIDIDIDNVGDPKSFCQGLDFMLRAIRMINGEVWKDMMAFDGDPQADGVRLVIEKQETVFTEIQALVAPYID